jgi:hypothetical protein
MQGDAGRGWKQRYSRYFSGEVSGGDDGESMRLIMGKSRLTSVPLWGKPDANQIVDLI